MMTFMKCERCGNILTFLHNSGIIPECCGTPMQRLLPGLVDGDKEKHVPVINIVSGNKSSCCDKVVTVLVGEVPHPMVKEHSIFWIILETDKGFRIHYLSPLEEPKADFVLQKGEQVIAAYTYCNIHGLWRSGMS